MAATPSVSGIRKRLDALTLTDRRRLDRRLRGVEKLRGARRAEALAAVIAAVGAAEETVASRRKALPAEIPYPEELPITEWRDELLQTIRENQVVIVAGETGSGKSTQLPKLCLELGRGLHGRIGHTQPRRIAARSIAERIAEELGTAVGGLIGYKFRFTDQVADHTLVKVMTDGILLNELQRDRNLLDYDTIIIDEAHERSLNIDFLLGYLKQLIRRRRDLKVIITSATIDTERFSDHFEGAPIVEVSGRAYPVEIRYRPLVSESGAEPRDQTDGIVSAVSELGAEGAGDILVFCSGEREIRDAAEALREMQLAHTEVLPLFGRLSAAEQHRVFAGHTGRRIVVATNVAETSLTVPGIRYVVDAGTARISRFSRRTKVQRLPIEAISQASADQRAGRCGRLGPGICIRLYSSDDYLGRPEFTDPEILRTSLAAVILQMAAIGLGDIEQFPFVEPPDTRTIRDGISLLEELQAVSGPEIGTRRWLTDIGRNLARIPLDPRLGRMLIAASDEGCLREVLVIASALSIIDPRERPTDKEQHAAEMHRRFADESSDFVSILNLWKYISSARKERTSGEFRRMCRREFLNWRRLREWQDIHSQLRRVSNELGLRMNRKPASPADIHRALLAGMLSHIGSKDPDSFEYRGARGARFSINPGSVLFKRSPQWVMAGELVETSRTWGRYLAPVDPEVVEAVGSHLINRTISDPSWDEPSGHAVANETVTMLGMTLVGARRVVASRFDPAVARQLFIRHALVYGEWETHHEFVDRNQAALDEVRAMEARGRADLLVDEDTMVRFFDARIPADVVSVRHFDRWWRTTREDQPHLLDFTVDDLVLADAADVDDALFPAQWLYGDVALELTYEFDPTSQTDGVTIVIPAALLDRIDPDVFEWNVPGFRSELIAALIRSLPKPIRKKFVPAPETARHIASRIGPQQGGLIEVLRRELTALGDTVVLPDDFDIDAVPAHLTPTFAVVEESGRPIATGRDLSALRESLRADARQMAAESTHPLERSGITTWDFGDLPRVVTLHGEGSSVAVYPALIDDEDSVSIRLVATRQEQLDLAWKGLRRLVLLQLPAPGRMLRSLLGGRSGIEGALGPYRDREEWMADCLQAAVDDLMSAHPGPVESEAAFATLLATVRDGLADTLEVIGTESAKVLAALQELEMAAGNMPERHAEAVDDVARQVRQFIYPGFVTGVGAGRLQDVSRYLAAAAYRLQRVSANPERDRDLMARVNALEAELDQLASTLPWSRELVEVSWMLQELRVSFFAQSIGARGPISVKRVTRALDDLLLPQLPG